MGLPKSLRGYPPAGTRKLRVLWVVLFVWVICAVLPLCEAKQYVVIERRKATLGRNSQTVSPSSSPTSSPATGTSDDHEYETNVLWIGDQKTIRMVDLSDDDHGDLASKNTDDESIVTENVPITVAAQDVAYKTGDYPAQWNLDRIDHQGMDGYYTYNESYLGNDVDLYILDTGVQSTHPAFFSKGYGLGNSRVEAGYSAFSDTDQATEDCNGHGTHVASTAAGWKFGVARAATIIPVKILDCGGQGSLMSLAQGVSWAIDRISTNKHARRAIVNLSIQGGGNDGIDEVVKELYLAGAVVVVAAANFNSDACGYSPARLAEAITVGATSLDDSRLSTSNYGSCVDVYAPGDTIPGASVFSSQKSVDKRGTSMATPLVSGIVAATWSSHSDKTDDIIRKVLTNTVTLGKSVFDEDCAGTLEGAKLIRGSFASRPKTVTVPIYGVEYWRPMFTDSRDNQCVRFRVPAVTSAPWFRLLFGTRRLSPGGIAAYEDAYTQCKDTRFGWYEFQGKVGSAMSYADFTGKRLSATGSVISGQDLAALILPSNDPLKVRLIIKDPVNAREYASVEVDTRDQQALYYLGFSTASANKASVFEQVSYCSVLDGSVISEELPTPSPTMLPSVRHVTLPHKITVTKRNKGKLFTWLFSETGCVQFYAKLDNQRIFIAQTPVTDDQTFPSASTSAASWPYVSKITRRTVGHRGILRTYKSPFPKRTWIRIANSSAIYIKRNANWQQIVDISQDYDSSTNFVSISSSSPKTFTQIRTCVVT